MASRFATELLEKIDQGDGMLTALETAEYEDLIDAELQDIREALELLYDKTSRVSRHVTHGSAQRINALMARLNTGQ